MGKFSKRVFAAAVAAPLAFTGAAMAQEPEIRLTTEQQMAVELAQDFNRCVADQTNDPEIKAQREAYNAQKDAAKITHRAEMDKYIIDSRVYNQEFRRIAERDGVAPVLQDLNDKNAKLDAPFDFASTVLQTEIEALRAEVEAKVKAETGISIPVWPKSAEERMTLAKPEDPAIFCNKTINVKIEEIGISDRVAEAALREVLKNYGAQTYRNLTAPQPK